MRVFDLRTDDGQLRAFEVENLWLSRRGVARIVRSIPGVQVTRSKWSWRAQDDFCEFEFNGVRFIAEEPFGDNSRYWIGPTEPGHAPELAAVRQRFLSTARPEWISARLFTGLILLYMGMTMWASTATRWDSLARGRALVAVLAVAAGIVITASWAVALVRGHYRSRIIEQR